MLHKEIAANRCKRITIKEKKGKKIMKKLINKWLKSEYYKEYCINVARMYNFHVAC
jgi:hypothetical protein